MAFCRLAKAEPFCKLTSAAPAAGDRLSPKLIVPVARPDSVGAVVDVEDPGYE